ncbi:SDR family oxidoreductase [candidate division KSB1 bacterium]|nr:SDR family oxidoreductase [candidate division KSB1 bacterium]RQW08968.1 MAG: SDR family oxidoreductase [candidate division KSB1 bacterium]
MKFLVTGGAGFIGSNLTEALLQRAYDVVVLDNFSTGLRKNLLGFDAYKGSFQLIEGDLRDLDTCREACRGVDYVLHQGALGSVPRSIAHPITTNENNVTGSLNMFLAARDEGVKRIVFASSSSVYGNSKTMPKVETMIPNPISPYAASKNICEMYGRIFYELYGIEIIALRYFNVFGRRQDPNSAYAAVIPLFVKALMRGERPIIFGDGLQSRDFSYVDNVILANILATQAPREACGQVFNIACGKRTTLIDLYKKICELLDIHREPKYVETRAGDVKHSLADISRAREFLGYEPKYDVFQGLEMAIDWYRTNAGSWM